jgi:hypothetical protein
MRYKERRETQRYFDTEGIWSAQDVMLPTEPPSKCQSDVWSKEYMAVVRVGLLNRMHQNHKTHVFLLLRPNNEQSVELGICLFC